MAHRPDKATLENRLTNLMQKAKPAPTPNQTAGSELAPNRSGSLPLLLALLTILLLFSVAQVQPQPPTITGPIAAITVNQAPTVQTADLTDNNAPLTVIHAQSGFHCYAACSLLHPGRSMDQIYGSKPKDI